MHRRCFDSIVVLLAAVMALGWAAPAALATDSIGGPALGFLFDPHNRSLRPLLGIPGAAHIAESLPLGVQLNTAEVAPGQGYALAVTADERFVWIDLRSATPIIRELQLGLSEVSRIAVSPSGSAAAVYDRRGRQIRILNNLTEQPALREMVSLDGLDASATAIAISDDAKSVLIATAADASPLRSRRSGGLGVLWHVSSTGNVRRLGQAGRVSGVSFVPGRKDALVADPDRGEVLLIKDVQNAATTTILASARDGLAQPQTVIADGVLDRAIVSMRDDNRLALIPLDGGPIQFVDCACRPLQAAPLRTQSLYRLTDSPAQPVYLLDASRLDADGTTPAPRVFFIPASDDGARSQDGPVTARR